MASKFLLSVDPGGEHVGVAQFVRHPSGGWVCVEALEVTPAEFVQLLHRSNLKHTTVVVETFRLYPDKAMAQVGSEVPTAELIGYIKWSLKTRGLPDPVMQPAAIKRPTEGLMKVKGLKHRAVVERQGGHAKDAETHGVHYVLRRLEEPILTRLPPKATTDLV